MKGKSQLQQNSQKDGLESKVLIEQHEKNKDALLKDLTKSIEKIFAQTEQEVQIKNKESQSYDNKSSIDTISRPYKIDKDQEEFIKSVISLQKALIKFNTDLGVSPLFKQLVSQKKVRSFLDQSLTSIKNFLVTKKTSIPVKPSQKLTIYIKSIEGNITKASAELEQSKPGCLCGVGKNLKAFKQSMFNLEIALQIFNNLMIFEPVQVDSNGSNIPQIYISHELDIDAMQKDLRQIVNRYYQLNEPQEIVKEVIKEVFKQIIKVIKEVPSKDQSKQKLQPQQVLQKFSHVPETDRLAIANELFYGIGVSQKIHEGLNIYLEEAKKENIKALNILCQIYYDNKILPQDIDRCVNYCERSINKKSPIGWFYLGQLFEKSLITKSISFTNQFPQADSLSSMEKAIKCYEISVQFDYVDAIVQLGIIYQNDHLKIQKDMKKAIDYLEKAVVKDNARAMNSLGVILMAEENLLKKGFELINQSANNNFQSGIGNLAMCYIQGLGVEQNLMKGVDLLKKIVNLQDNNVKFIYAQYLMNFEQSEQTYFEAFQLLSIVTYYDVTNYEAFYQLGKLYQFGLGVNKDFVVALKYYKLAADQEYAPAINALADFLYSGTVDKPDIEKAIQLYKKAAQMNNVDAMLNLGSYYEKIDLQESIKYYEKASKMDNSWGLLNLGLIYLEMDDKKENAMTYLQLAAEQGNPRAIEYLSGWQLTSQIEKHSQFVQEKVL